MEYGDRIEFLGKSAGWVNKNNENANLRCKEFTSNYEKMKLEAVEIIKNVTNKK